METEYPTWVWVVYWIVMLINIVSLWKIFLKANRPGWASIIPIYNSVVMLQIVRKPVWWIILLFIPIVNIVIGFMVSYELAKVFGKGLGFFLGLVFLSFIFMPILAFSDAKYMAVEGQSSQQPPQTPQPPQEPMQTSQPGEPTPPENQQTPLA